MAYQVFENLTGPNQVLEKIRDFLVANDWTVVNNCTDDLALDGSGSYDGKVLAATKSGLYMIMRSANGKAVFEDQANHVPGSADGRAYGIGLTSATAYTLRPASGYWYDQPNAPKNLAQQVIGVGIPVKQSNNLRLYCNYVSEPEISLVFSLELEKGIFQHLAFANTQKVGTWNGGAIFSGSRNSYFMFPANWTGSTIAGESNHLYGMSANPSTFLRVDVDAAPLRQNPVLWAAAGPAGGRCSTGKILATPVMNMSYLPSMPKIPHYGYLQSQTNIDYGRNVNTLNCISVNLPLALFVQRDPDSLMNFSQVGYVPGIFSISMRNVAAGSVYEISYPKSGNLHQVFPHVQRAGQFGYDGFSVMQ